jgi:hypothetical protein
VFAGDLVQHSLSLASTGAVSTQRRYFGHHTTWYFSENTAPAFFAYRESDIL